MPQVKKEGMREAILEAAFEQFSRNGYSNTKMSDIARAAGMTTGNLYIYFDSKLLLLYEIYTPWMRRQLEALGQSVQRLRTPRTRLRRIFLGLWRDIPEADRSFANTLVEALTSAPKDMGKLTDSLAQVEAVVRELIEKSVPSESLNAGRPALLTHISWMAFDGFVINTRIGDTRDIEAIADYMTDLLLGQGPNRKAPKASRP